MLSGMLQSHAPNGMQRNNIKTNHTFEEVFLRAPLFSATFLAVCTTTIKRSVTVDPHQPLSWANSALK
jgi:hypothetical protein